MKRLLPLVAALAAAPLSAAPAEAEAGRALVKRYGDAIIGVELVVTMKVRFGGNEQPPRDQQIEVNGTVLDASGLTVTSLAAVDPKAMFDAARAQQGGGRGGPELMSAEFKEVKLRTADGKEVPARFVLKDSDLDLAFIAPETADAEKKYAHVSLAQAARGEVLARYHLITRAPKTLQRVTVVQTTECIGEVEKPRRFYLMSAQAPASPVFDAEGKVLGILLNHFSNGRPTGMIVLPSADIADIAKQASAAQAGPKPAN